MKNIFLAAAALCSVLHSNAQPAAEKIEILYGRIALERLATSPSDKWYLPNYEGYQVNPEILSALKKINSKDISIQVFLGTWCGDSRREVPRFMKMLNEMSFPIRQVEIIAVGGSDSLVKQSPQHEESGKGIFRVPVFIIYKNGIEINRINEYPALSLEKDLWMILSNKPYTPNYRSFATIRQWLTEGTLLDKNINSRGLAWQLKPFVGGENELNSLGHLWLNQEHKDDALRLFQMNAVLYPESSIVQSSLGEGYLRTGDKKNAVLSLERALELNKDPVRVKEILRLLYEAKLP